MIIGANAQAQPYALVTPDIPVNEGTVLSPLAKRGLPISKKLPTKLESLASSELVSAKLDLLQTTLAQVTPCNSPVLYACFQFHSLCSACTGLNKVCQVYDRIHASPVGWASQLTP